MNLRKTWFGYFNFAISLLITGALVIVAAFVLLFALNGGIVVKEDTLSMINATTISYLIIGVVFAGLLVALYFCIRKLRVNISYKTKLFRDNRAVHFIGASISLACFIAGIILRMRHLLTEDIPIPFDSDLVYNIFTGQNITGSIGNFDLLYARILAFLYKFIGIRPGLYVYFNLILACATIIFVFFAVSGIFDEITALVPTAFLCLSPSVYMVIDTVYTGKLLKYCLVSFIVFIAVKLLNLFSEEKGFDIFALIIINVVITSVVVVLPLMLPNKFRVNFEPGKNDFFESIFLYDNSIIWFVVLSLAFIGVLSFLKSSTDRLSPAAFSLIVGTAFFMVFTGMYDTLRWPDENVMIAIISTLAGLGLNELLFSPVYIADFKEEETPNESFIIHKPAFNPITRIETAGMLTDSATSVNEELIVEVTGKHVLDTVREITRNAVNTPEIQVNSANAETSVTTSLTPDKPAVSANGRDNKLTAAEDKKTFKEKKEKKIKEKRSRKDKEANMETATVQNAENTNTSSNLIENPLPLPKRNARKAIEFKFEPDEAQMKFDVEIGPDDDFDI